MNHHHQIVNSTKKDRNERRLLERLKLLPLNKAKESTKKSQKRKKVDLFVIQLL